MVITVIFAKSFCDTDTRTSTEWKNQEGCGISGKPTCIKYNNL